MPTKSKSPTTTNTANRRDRLPPVHPGEVLGEEFIIPMGITSYRVAVDIGVPLPRVNDVVLQKRAMTADLALRLEKYFGVSAAFWMNLQTKFDLDAALDEIEDELAKIPRFDRDAATTKVVRPRTAARMQRIVKRRAAAKR
jgi:addiction module HigA family antidote